MSTHTSIEFQSIEVGGVDVVGTSPWFTFIACFLGNVMAGLISTLMSVYLPIVVGDLMATSSTSDLGQTSAWINAVYIAGWTIGGFSWGYLSDRIGRRSSLALAVGLLGVFTAAVSFAPSWEWVVFLRLWSGFSVGGILVITPTLLSEVWPSKTLSVILGMDSIGFPIGIFSSGLVSLLGGWRSAFLVGLIPIALAIVTILFVTESTKWKDAKTQAHRPDGEGNHRDRRNLIRGTLIFGSMLIGLWGMFSWIPTWVQTLLTDSNGQTERPIAMMLLGGGGLLGGLASGWISNALGVRKAMMLCFGGCMVMAVLLFGLNSTFSNAIYPELALLSMCFGISQGLLSIYIPQLFPYHLRGTYTGICFNAGRIITTLAIFFVGVLVTSLGGYGNALLAFTAIFVVGFISLYFDRESKPLNQ